ncbi:predicted membrane protein [Longilinea arvoryzae]|uniref:Predicted membrane protein n=1 Tax=Longilinea arvoryzae TaxID=360412 RepID=A0A0S7BJT5_9CHLR|nr:phage holin family protein [Longilinea arvoryzae]GAP15360.1 predicted membrane protein [Longilinea arvoryzae]
MRRFLLRLIINAVALYAAIALMRNYGITPTSQNWYDYLWLALIFGVINAVIKPLLIVASCPLLVLTLGLGTLLINTLLFFLAGWIGTQFGVGFTVDGFLPAFFGALIVSIVSWVLSAIFRDEVK